MQVVMTPHVSTDAMVNQSRPLVGLASSGATPRRLTCNSQIEMVNLAVIEMVGSLWKGHDNCRDVTGLAHRTFIYCGLDA